jgi:N-methylhydantoinase A
MEFAAMESARVLGAAQTTRNIYWGEAGQHVATPVWEIGYGDRIPRLTGPALVQLPDSVVVIRPAQTAEMDELGNIIISIL